MYGAIKAHKPEKNYPMRIIVLTVGTPVYGLSKYLVNITQATLNKNEIRLTNTASFVDKAKNWDISPSEVQVSFDVVNLYPSVPINKAILVMMDILKGELRSFSIFQYVTENDRIVFSNFCRFSQIFIDFEIEAILFVEILNSTLDFIKEIYFGRELGENLIGYICKHNKKRISTRHHNKTAHLSASLLVNSSHSERIRARIRTRIGMFKIS